jgi:hypothetical protein
MAETKWSAYLSYKAKHTDIESELKGSFVPVAQFGVRGGTKRKVDLTSTDDISLVSEFEQARGFKNISLFLPRTRGFEWHHFWEIANHGLPVTIAFFASGSAGKTLKHEFILTCPGAKITGSPGKVPDWSGNELLRVDLSLPETKLEHGSFQGSEFVKENW